MFTYIHVGMPQKRSKGISDSVGVQNRTLTYWINDKLAHYEHKVKDLAKDLDDGVILIELLQTLTGKIVPERYVCVCVRVVMPATITCQRILSIGSISFLQIICKCCNRKEFSLIQW